MSATNSSARSARASGPWRRAACRSCLTEGETWGFDVVTDFVIGLDHIRLKFFNLSPGTNVVPLLTGTADGTLVTLDGAGTILFRGLDAIGYGLDDLLA